MLETIFNQPWWIVLLTVLGMVLVIAAVLVLIVLIADKAEDVILIPKRKLNSIRCYLSLYRRDDFEGLTNEEFKKILNKIWDIL